MRIKLLEKINPMVKVVTILILCVMMALTRSWQVNLWIFGVNMALLLLLSGCSLKRLFGTLLPVCLLAGAVFVSGLLNGKAEQTASSIYQVTTVGSALMLSTRILAYVSFGLLFALSTDPREFIMSLMHQAKLKPKFAYGVLAAYHLVPTLRREWDEVNLAYLARQKSTGVLPLGPLFNTLVNGIRWSENVAMAMESKGFDGEAKRTFRMVTRVSARDFAWAACMLALMTVNMLLH